VAIDPKIDICFEPSDGPSADANLFWEQALLDIFVDGTAGEPHPPFDLWKSDYSVLCHWAPPWPLSCCVVLDEKNRNPEYLDTDLFLLSLISDRLGHAEGFLGG
jgi:hypothetical protein